MESPFVSDNNKMKYQDHDIISPCLNLPYEFIGYARGLIVLWNRDEAKAEKTYYANQQLEAISMQTDGTQFISAHNDGSYILWSAETGTEPIEPPNTPYGPYPCKAISKIHRDLDQDGVDWTVFCGGMPRASYSDKFTVIITTFLSIT